MKTKKIISLLIVLALIFSVLGTTLIACNKDQGTDETTGETENEDKDQDKDEEEEDGIPDKEEVVPTQIDTEAIKTAMSPIFKSYLMLFDFEGADIEHAKLMNLNDETWEYYVSIIEKSGMTQEQAVKIAEMGTTVVDEVIAIVQGYMELIYSNDVVYPADYLQENVDVEMIQDILDLTNYIGDNVRPEQLYAAAQAFNFLADIATGKADTTDRGVDISLEEVENLFEQINSKDVYDNYFKSGYDLGSIVGKYLNLFGDNEGNYLLGKVINLLFKMNGLTASEVKALADVVFEFIGVNASNPEFVLYSQMNTAINQLSAAQIKNAMNVVAKLLSGMTNDSDTYRILCEIMDEVLEITNNDEAKEIVQTIASVIKNILPEGLTALAAIQESDIQTFLDIHKEYVEQYEENPAKADKLMLGAFEFGVKINNNLSENAQNALADLFGEDVFGKIESVLTKPVSQMTDEECTAAAIEIGYLQVQESSGDIVTKSWNVKSDIYFEKGTSAQEIFDYVREHWGYYKVPATMEEAGFSVDTSETGGIYATLVYMAKDDDTEEMIRYEGYVYIRIYDANFTNELKFSDPKTIEVVSINKGCEISGDELKSYATRFLSGSYLLRDTLTDDYISASANLTQVTGVNTDVVGMYAGVATYDAGIFGTLKVPFLYNIFDAEKPIDIIVNASDYAVQGMGLQIEVVAGYFVDVKAGDYRSETKTISADELVGFDADKLGIQVYSFTAFGKTFKGVVKVITREEFAEKFEIELNDNYYFTTTTADDMTNFCYVPGYVSVMSSYRNFNDLDELQTILAPYNMTVSWDLNTSVVNEDQTFTISIKYGNEVIYSVSSTYYIEQY